MTIKTKFFVGAVVALVAAFGVQTASAAYMHTVTLKQGSTGVQVMSLQQTLNMTSCKVALSGAGAPGMETTTFGPKTKVAVQCFQAANGLTADGVVGLMTGGKLAMVTGGSTGGNFPAGCTSSVGYSPTTGQPCSGGNNNNNNGNNGSLNGTDGTIDSVEELTQYSDEEVGESEEDVKIVGFEVTTSNDGDVRLRSVRVEFDPAGNGSGDSDRLDDYISNVKVWMGDDEVGSADVEDFSESDDIYSKTINLSNAVVDSDDEVEFFITVSGANNLDSGDIDTDAWVVDVTNIRYEDGSGVVSTYDENDLPTDVEFDLVDFGTAADIDLKVSSASDSPEAGIVMVDEDDGEDDVVLLKGRFKLEGDSDVNIDEVPVTITSTISTISEIASRFTLVIDDEEYSENAPTVLGATTVTFDDLDFDLSAGDTVDFEVRADINGTDDYTEGATLMATITSSQVDNVLDAEDEEGEDLSTGEKSGSATGEAQEFRSDGIDVDLVSTSETKSASDTNDADTATFTIKFKVTAIGDDIYVSTTASTGGSDNNTYTVYVGSTATLTDVSEAIVNNTDNDVTSGGNWLIEAGQSETITLTILRSGSATDGLYQAVLSSIKWNTTDSSSSYSSYTSNLDEFKTDFVSLD